MYLCQSCENCVLTCGATSDGRNLVICDAFPEKVSEKQSCSHYSKIAVIYNHHKTIAELLAAIDDYHKQMAEVTAIFQ